MENLSEQERWLPLIEGEYDISSHGRVKSLERTYINAIGQLMPLKQRILRPTLNSFGYLRISLNFDGAQKTEKIHRLVALVFLDNPNNLPEVNHKDGNKQNNCSSNLEWCDRPHNIRHALTNSLIKTKLDEDDVVSIREKARQGTPLRKIAEEYGLVEGTIWNIVKYKIWQHVP